MILTIAVFYVILFFGYEKSIKNFFRGGEKEMRKFKKIALLCALLMIATIGTTAGANAGERNVVNTAVSAEGTTEAKKDIAIDGDKLNAAGLSAPLPHVTMRRKAATALGASAEEMKSAQIAGTLRVGLGGADLTGAKSFRFLLQSSSAIRLKFGFIDKSGTAYLIKKQFSTTENGDTATIDRVTYYNYSMKKIRDTRANGQDTDLNYIGVRFNDTGNWGASYVDISKEAFVNALSYKMSNGVAFGHGYSNGDENAVIDWSNIDSMFIEMVNYASFQSNVNFYNLQAVSANGVSAVVNAANFKKIEKPAYNAENSGYELNDYSFGTRPTLPNESLSTYFDDCLYSPESYYEFSKGGEIWASDGTAQNLTGYNAISYYVDNTVVGEAATEIDWQFVVKDANDTNYYGAGAGIRIPDGGEAQELQADVQKIPAGFKGQIVIPFTSFKIEDSKLAGIKRTLVKVPTSGIASGLTYKLEVDNINYIPNYETYHTAAQKNAVSGAVTTFCESFAMTDGAALRVKKGDYGLRFMVNLSASAYEALKTAAENAGVSIELGAILASDDSLNGAPLTKENAEMSLIVGKWNKENESFFATLGYDKIKGYEGVIYTVRGYLTLTFADGSTQTVYTGWSVPENGEKKEGGAISRSLKQVAEAVSLDENFEKEFNGKSEKGKAYAREVLEQILGTANA